MTSYVILSRLKIAGGPGKGGLILARACSKDLFQNGTPPGPHCLLKFLRARFTAAGQGASNEAGTPTSVAASSNCKVAYALADAQTEFESLMNAYDAKRGVRKLRGTTWKCEHCSFELPACMYGVDIVAEDAVL